MQKKSKANIAAGVFFSLYFLFYLFTALLSSIVIVNNQGQSFIVVLCRYGVLTAAFLLLAIASFIGRNRVLTVAGFALGVLGEILYFVSVMDNLFDDLQQAAASAGRISAVLSIVNNSVIRMVPMLVCLVFAILILQRGTVEKWAVPGIVAAVCALIFGGIIGFNQLLYSSVSGFSWNGLFAFLYLAVYNIATMLPFVLGVFCLMKYYSVPEINPPEDPSALWYGQNGYQYAQDYAQQPDPFGGGDETN